MGKFKIIERRANPGVKESTQVKYYAAPVTDRALSETAFANLATTDASLSKGEMLTALELYAKTARQQLLQGHSVEIPGIGTLRVSFSSEGANSPEEFNARTMIKNVRVLLRLKPEIKEALKNGMYYENAGVKVGNVEYPSVAAYKRAKAEAEGLNPDANTGGATTGGNDDTPSVNEP